eukprot:365052-Chlamydomonas_euryale.AAC.23
MARCYLGLTSVQAKAMGLARPFPSTLKPWAWHVPSPPHCTTSTRLKPWAWHVPSPPHCTTSTRCQRPWSTPPPPCRPRPTPAPYPPSPTDPHGWRTCSDDSVALASSGERYAGASAVVVAAPADGAQRLGAMWVRRPHVCLKAPRPSWGLHGRRQHAADSMFRPLP